MTGHRTAGWTPAQRELDRLVVEYRDIGDAVLVPCLWTGGAGWDDPDPVHRTTAAGLCRASCPLLGVCAEAGRSDPFASGVFGGTDLTPERDHLDHDLALVHGVDPIHDTPRVGLAFRRDRPERAEQSRTRDRRPSMNISSASATRPSTSHLLLRLRKRTAGRDPGEVLVVTRDHPLVRNIDTADILRRASVDEARTGVPAPASDVDGAADADLTGRGVG